MGIYLAWRAVCDICGMHALTNYPKAALVKELHYEGWGFSRTKNRHGRYVYIVTCPACCVAMKQDSLPGVERRG